ncbi:MAG: sensor histidine kinase [Chthoniobacterales bacterium]
MSNQDSLSSPAGRPSTSDSATAQLGTPKGKMKGTIRGTPRVHLLELLTGTLCTLIGTLMITGWVLGNARIINVIPGALPMVPMTALCTVTAGFSLLLLAGRRALPVARILALLLMVLCLLPVLESLTGWDDGINRLIVAAKVTAPIRSPTPLLSICFLLASAFIWTSANYSHKDFRIKVMFGLGSTLMGISIIMMGVPSSAFSGTFAPGWWQGISLYTQSLLMLLSLSFLHLTWLEYKNRWELGRSFTSVLLVILALQFGATVITGRNAETNIVSAEHVKHTQEAILMIEKLKRTLNEKLTGPLGYDLGADKKDLPLAESCFLEESYLKELKDFTKKNPAQQDHLTQLEGLLPKWQALRNEGLQSRDKGVAATAADLILSAREKDLIGQMNVIMNKVLMEENRLLEVRVLKVRRLNQVTLGTSIFSSLAMITLLLSGGLSLNREVGKTRGRAAELEIANRELAFQNEEKAKRAAELEIANRELAFQNDEKAKRAAELEIAVKELEAFTYSVAHDLRTPLRAVDGFSKILEEDYAGRLDAEGHKIIGVLRNESQRMGDLIDDLLTFSRIGRQKSEPESIDMQDLARKVYSELAAPAIGCGRTINLDLHPLPPAHGSLAMIRLLWVNLIENAIKFTKGHNPAQIEINWRKSEVGEGGDAGETVYFIRDNGAGFDMRHVGKLFGVFQRLHSDGEFPGTGIGLSLVKRIIERHGGRVWAEGEVGKGATFSFTLPNGVKPRSGGTCSSTTYSTTT